MARVVERPAEPDRAGAEAPLQRAAPEEADVELREWLDSLEYVIRRGGPERVEAILSRLRARAAQAGVVEVAPFVTPYVNTIPAEAEPPYPGDKELERRIEAVVRWNAAAMVVRANRRSEGIGGHLATYQSAAVLYEVGFHHFFRGPKDGFPGDQVFFQGHAAPGMYARAFVEGRLEEAQLENFRRELAEGGGLSSYPHPWLMPRFWQFPTVSMGLGPLMAIHQARFNRYLEHRGLADTKGVRVWAFLGDGEVDEPEALAAIRLAAREGLDNLTFVVNCNLQRLDGPVRGNGKIVQELEAFFRGAGWNVVKVLWSSDWDPIFARDETGALVERLGRAVDGELQKCAAEGGAYMREHLFDSPELARLVENLSDEELARLRPGGVDPDKVYAAYRAAVETKGRPTVVLAQTVKGYGLPGGAARNIAHELKTMTDEELLEFRARFGVPIGEAEAREARFVRLPDGSPEMAYLRERRAALGGHLPERRPEAPRLAMPDDAPFREFAAGSERPVSTTMALVRLLTNLLRDKEIGPRIVPIIPDEARTFGMESLFRLVGIYSPVGQLYEPVDARTLLPYREAKDGQILEEGINEAGSLASFIAAGTSGYTHGVTMVPFFWFYSMFGLQRVGDLAWAAAEMRAKGFLIGGLSGRTQLAGEGLQHQDGHSHLLALPIPNLLAYDPAYAYEIAVIVRDGLRRMFVEGEPVFYYLTVGNETYPQPPMPKGVEEGIVRGLYLFRPGEGRRRPRVRLFGSGAILNEVVRAQELLAESFGVAADVFSVTSYKLLHRDAMEVEHWNRHHPGEAPRRPYLREVLGDDPAPVVAASDYVRALPDSIARWLPGRLHSLGTDGFGRSESREMLRDFFEVDAKHIAWTALVALAEEGRLPAEKLEGARAKLGVRAKPLAVNV
ncbi:MAG: pyruvate dehydrogenase (acetyl-transferring), homodimeric type [Clostridia bacterium]|nr:pyruvate dehydrogenase (acetyl-transferring), homodimeric type [Clostridia bacterium]